MMKPKRKLKQANALAKWRLRESDPRPSASLIDCKADPLNLALPFALFGVGAVLHVGGHRASVAGHVVVAGLSSADTVTSVGAVGATAYFVF